MTVSSRLRKLADVVRQCPISRERGGKRLRRSRDRYANLSVAAFAAIAWLPFKIRRLTPTAKCCHGFAVEKLAAGHQLLAGSYMHYCG